jgi:hypothetical protein
MPPGVPNAPTSKAKLKVSVLMDSPDQAKLARGQSIVGLLRGRFACQIEITKRNCKN